MFFLQLGHGGEDTGARGLTCGFTWCKFLLLQSRDGRHSSLCVELRF